MPVLTKINTNVIADNAVTSAKIPADSIISDDLAPNIALTGGSVSIPSVTTANLPGAVGGTNASLTATNGMLVYNSTLGMLQQRASGIWSGITTAPVITSFTYSDGATATAEKTVVGLVSVSCTTQTSTTVLVPGASLGIQVGMVVAGTGIPVGATVVSVIEDTSFVLSAAATASATVTLTFGGAVTITGTNFDSVLGGTLANIAVTFDGTSATSISVNSLKTIITCTPPAHAAGTITLLVTNASGLTASTNFVYDVEPIFTTAAGSLGGFVENTVFTANASAPIIAGTENSVALTSGFARVTSATDDTVITTAINGLTLQGTGHLTGTLTAASNATTFPFYAVATDDEGQKTAPRLFNIISYDYAASGGTITTHAGGFKVHIFSNFSASENFVVNATQLFDILIIAGGGGGSPANHAAGGGAGGFIYYSQKSLAAATYAIAVGAKGSGGTAGNRDHTSGTDTTFGTLTTAEGGGRGGYEGSAVTQEVGGSGGGSGSNTNAASRLGANGTANQGNKGGDAPNQGWHGSGGGGGASSEGIDGTATGVANTGVGGAGGAGYTTGATGIYNFTTAGTVTFPANFTAASTSTSYSGGGGGGGNTSGGSASHGGGAGSTVQGVNATGYGGGGGGAGRQAGAVKGGDGYQGVVIIRYVA